MRRARTGLFLESCGSATNSVEPVTKASAEDEAVLRVAGSTLSLAGRLFLALMHRIGATAWTADGAWRDLPNALPIR